MWRRKTESKEIPPLTHSSAQRPSGEPGERNINKLVRKLDFLFQLTKIDIYFLEIQFY